MSDKTAVDSQKTTTITVQNGQQEVPFRCFDNPAGKALVREIMGGEYYRWPADLPAPKTIVDVGATVGAAALWFSMNFPGAKIHCFEPSPLCHSLLDHNLRNVLTASIETYGLYDRDATLPLFRGRDDPLNSSIGQSAQCAQQADKVDLRQASAVLNELGIGQFECLKLDTCGSEVPILEGMAHWLPDIAVVFANYYSEGDRRRIEVLLTQHHMLVGGHALGPHRGRLAFARRASFPDVRKRDEPAIRMAARRGEVMAELPPREPAAT